MIEPVRRADGSLDTEATRAKLQECYRDTPGDQTWQDAYNQLWEQEQQRAITERLAGIEAKIPSLPGTTIGDWPLSARNPPGLVYDDALARSSRCTRIQLGEGGYMVFSQGVHGALDDEQIGTFCAAGFEDVEASPEQARRLLALATAANTCSTEALSKAPDKHADVYYSCLGKELRKQGVTP